MPSRDMMEPHISWQRAEEWNTLADEHRHSRDHETLNEAGTQESLNRNSTVDVQMVDASGSQLRNDFSGRPRHLFDNASDSGG